MASASKRQATLARLVDNGAQLQDVLVQRKRLIVQRETLITAAIEEGASVTEIAKACGVSRAAIHQVLGNGSAA